MKLFILLLLCLSLKLKGQPCANPISVVSTAIQGSCASPNSQTYIYTSSVLGTLAGLKAFTVTVWFRPNTKTSPQTEQALFRVTAASSDVIDATPNGVRLGLYYTADSSTSTNLRVQYAKSSQNKQSFTQSLPYLAQHWVFAAAGLDYNQGIVSYYAWQPYSPSVQVNPQPITESVNFNTALTSISQLELLYYGSAYTTFCGSINYVSWYPNYVETGYLHNWFNLAFYSTGYTFKVGAYYKFEDQNGQLLRDSSGLNAAGTLGATTAVETADGTFTGAPTVNEVQFTSGQYATLPGVKLSSTNLAYGVSFYFKSTATITADADNGDLTKDLVLLKRWYQGTSDMFGVMMYTASSNQYAMKIKLHGVLYSLPTVLASTNVWHFISVRVAYPNAITELSSIIFDVVLENSVFSSSYVTTLTNTYLESASDYITVGDKLNGYGGTLIISNVQFYTTYTSYIQENYVSGIPLTCNTNCQTSLNTPTYSQCLYCLAGTLLNNGQCVAACVAGPAAIKDTDSNVCGNCAYQCATCQTNGNCNSCTVGYYLQSNNIQCVVSASCTAPRVGDPSTLLCSLCGNGQHDGAELCDDGNFVSGDGCTTCLIDSGYVCSGANPDVCQLRCGDGVIQAAFGEQCDDGNKIPNDGCTLCQIDAKYKCVSSPIISHCTLLCGDAIREASEQCDDGNTNNYDGCSSTCTLEPGYACLGLTPDICTKLCGNGVLNFGEGCDDGNTIAGDGCTDCVVDQGWVCPLNVCHRVCGNGVRDLGEDCDNGIQPAGFGCTTCKVDTDYICVGGSLTTPDVCTMIPDICGDGIKKSSEFCDDGNTKDGDGCSHLCQIEIGFTCSGGSQYSRDRCYAVCGDGKRVGLEQCDDGNTFGGDGCDEKCRVEALYQCSGGTPSQPDVCISLCGNGVRDASEQCDDDNGLSGDGCSSSCQIESGWGCMTSKTAQRDQCFTCIPGCATCLDKTAQGCVVCYGGFFLHLTSCLAGCPSGYYADHTSYTCVACPLGCALCNSKLQCLQCQYNQFQFLGVCYSQCPRGYYNQPNVMHGNVCANCTSPCAACTTQNNCQACDVSYYMDLKRKCQSCAMGSQCMVCDHANGTCQQCIKGYYTNGPKCVEMVLLCGDGHHHPLEACDDGNLMNGDGCSSDCKIDPNWNCLPTQGPDTCYLLAPPSISTSISQVEYNKLFIHFNRPLKNGINFTDVMQVTIPALDNPNYRVQDPPNAAGVVFVHLFIPYEYVITQLTPTLIEVTTIMINNQIEFEYKLTVQYMSASINITQPNKVVDVYNWSLMGKQLPTNGRALQQQSNTVINASLQYYIFYSPNEIILSDIVSWVVFAFVVVGLISCAYYAYEIGEGRNWKLVEVAQTISMLRFLPWRYSANLEMLLLKLDYLNGTFIYNVFTIFLPDSEDVPTKLGVQFQILNYDTEFLLSGGGRFITWLGLLLTLLLINEILYRLELLESFTESVHKYFTYQGAIKFIELLFYDLILSVMVSIKVASFDTMMNVVLIFYRQIIEFSLAAFFLVMSVMLMIIVLKKFVFNVRLSKVAQFYDLFGTLFDGIGFESEQQKVFTIIPYIQKMAIAAILVFLDVPTYQVGGIVLVRILPSFLTYSYIPFYYARIYVREVIYETFLISFLLVTFTYRDFNGSKDQKQTNGWVLMSIIVGMVLTQCYWVRWAYKNIDKMTPPPIPDHVEVHDEDEQLRGKKKKVLVGVLEQENKMQEMENDFFGGK